MAICRALLGAAGCCWVQPGGGRAGTAARRWVQRRLTMRAAAALLFRPLRCHLPAAHVVRQRTEQGRCSAGLPSHDAGLAPTTALTPRPLASQPPLLARLRHHMHEPLAVDNRALHRFLRLPRTCTQPLPPLCPLTQTTCTSRCRWTTPRCTTWALRSSPTCPTTPCRRRWCTRVGARRRSTAGHTSAGCRALPAGVCRGSALLTERELACRCT